MQSPTTLGLGSPVSHLLVPLPNPAHSLPSLAVTAIRDDAPYKPRFDCPSPGCRWTS